MTGNIKKAFDLAQNEVEEKEIAHLKNIIKKTLEEKKRLEKNRDELDEKIKLIKQDIDDFKSGRLDKIKERHDANPIADVVVPIQITIINDNSRKYYPQKPWMWNYEVGWNLIGSAGYTITTASASPNSCLALCTSSSDISGCGTSGTAILCGTQSATFASGTYSLSDGSITNL